MIQKGDITVQFVTENQQTMYTSVTGALTKITTSPGQHYANYRRTMELHLIYDLSKGANKNCGLCYRRSEAAGKNKRNFLLFSCLATHTEAQVLSDASGRLASGFHSRPLSRSTAATSCH